MQSTQIHGFSENLTPLPPVVTPPSPPRISKQLFNWAYTRRPPAPLLLISKDDRLVADVAALRNAGFAIFVAYDDATSAVLKNSARCALPWAPETGGGISSREIWDGITMEQVWQLRTFRRKNLLGLLAASPPPQLRTLRRVAKEKKKQEMIRLGLLEPPKPKVKLRNLMKILASEATQDPTKLEKEIRTAHAGREQAHIDRNTARKLIPAEKREKKERKLFSDPTTVETIVSVYKLNKKLSHPKTIFKVEKNAKQNILTGSSLMTEGMSVVLVEGKSKSINRYKKLMLKIINWKEAEKKEEEENGGNKCWLVWQGSVEKPSFHRFNVQECLNESAAKKVFTDAGVAYYWELALNY
ncbi:PREDICTED: U4/U6 small nuclear ribonucleoprotein Prp3-like [Camelina sativa]|uniref:U4/U6 small nuclear ribonucleoprotein Prp3-like n=1 Tax=Camelina sativa TaxID=90675 RepID=A0ABM0YXJ7_CAMSA|nr:PREDICTED: U4/U6 small nuclear ribonucleoprotein Prp3-like [Camelina sativa]